jgi:hypothetical protein
MKRTLLVRLSVLLAAIALVASCDQRTPLTANRGGGGGGSTSSNPGAPVVSIDTVNPNPVNIGDSVLIAVHVRDDSTIQSLQIRGLTVHGTADLGTLVIFDRYVPVTAPTGANFRSGLRDTVIRRFLRPGIPVDTTLDSLVVIATATDGVKTGADTVVVRMVTGPKISFVTPIAGTQVFAGGDMLVVARGVHPDGIVSITINAQSQGTWPTPVNFTTTATFSPPHPKDTTAQGTVTIPTNAPVGGRLTFTASGIDINGKPGSVAMLTLVVKGQDTVPPLVTQQVSPRIELTDSVLVNSSGSSATTTIGVIVKDSVGTEIRRTTAAVTPFNNVSAWIRLPLTNAEQGKNLRITSFATDRLGRTGYAVAQNVRAAQANPALAWSDTTVVVYGRTYALPNTTLNTVVGDIAVDTAHASVFVSNINANRLEIWQGASRTFGTAIPVGSQPWGLAFGGSPDTLYVANSGGTNISRVYIGAGTKAEVLAQRILTRNTYAFIVTQVRDENTGKITLSVAGPISYSDRPQYLAVAKSGRVYYSTRPTAQAPAGTIRWLDPSLPVPDPQQIWQYGSRNAGGGIQYVLFNTDSVGLTKFTGIPNKSDIITIWDHPYGQISGSLVASDSDVVAAASALNAQGSDADLVWNLDIQTLALTDTTFLGVSGDRAWVAFGEGNTGRPGRIMMVNDPSGSFPGFFSPGVAVTDLLDNANERVYGVAVDSTGATVASHGDQSYFATINNPFHLRLQGKYDSFDNGAGVAFHPGANGYTSVASDRLAFVGSQSGYIEMVDIAYFLNRGKLAIKGNLYGPLRASRPFPGDPPGTVLKLFGLTKQGLVVIDLTAADIRPAP